MSKTSYGQCQHIRTFFVLIQYILSLKWQLITQLKRFDLFTNSIQSDISTINSSMIMFKLCLLNEKDLVQQKFHEMELAKQRIENTVGFWW